MFLEAAYLAAKRGLARVKSFCCGAKSFMFGDGKKVFEMAELSKVVHRLISTGCDTWRDFVTKWTFDVVRYLQCCLCRFHRATLMHVRHHLIPAKY